MSRDTGTRDTGDESVLWMRKDVSFGGFRVTRYASRFTYVNHDRGMV